MRPMRHRDGFHTLGLLLGLTLALCAADPAAAQSPPPAETSYVVTVQTDRTDSLHWEVLVSLDNPGPVAALTLPLSWGQGRPVYRIDSANYLGLRTEYFALKTFRVDTTMQTVLIGLISDLGGNRPPLAPGSGGIARLFFTARAGQVSYPLLPNTTFIRPHNTLQLVTPDVRAIHPRFVQIGLPVN